VCDVYDISLIIAVAQRECIIKGDNQGENLRIIKKTDYEAESEREYEVGRSRWLEKI
jgi:hypothetical protein